MQNIVILGAGTAGTMMANKLARLLSPKQWRVSVVDRDDAHVYQPGLLLLPFGSYREDELVRPRRLFLCPDVKVVLGEVERIEPDTKTVHVAGESALPYDILILATGCQIKPEESEGLAGTGWFEHTFDFYTLEGARALRDHLATFEGGKVVVNVVENPIKCPVAPLEFIFLADAFFSERGIRDKVELVYATPLDGAFTKPKASAMLGGLLEAKGVKVEADFGLEKVDGERKTLSSYDGRELDFDLLVSVPLHFGSEIIVKSQMGDDIGFVPTNKHTLQTDAHPEVFAIGDCTNLPSSKAGAVAHFQAEVLTHNVLRFIEGRELLPDFDGHANCFIETGHGKAMLIDFNYETEPLPGRYPLPGIGPFTLLEESHVNHWGKLAFKWIYWNKLLPGDELPLDHRMLMAGKWR